MNALSWWKQTFGEIAPVGYVLRSHLHHRWVRFHSLPESKRYPESEEESDIVLSHNLDVANYLFSRGEEICIFKSIFHYSGDPEPAAPEIAGVQLSNDSRLVSRACFDNDDAEDDLFHTWQLSATWGESLFSEIIRRVAIEQEHSISFVSPASGNIFCPYDGGMDTFSASAELGEIRQKFSVWLSKHPAGL
jgi:hypothetical protein